MPPSSSTSRRKAKPDNKSASKSEPIAINAGGKGRQDRKRGPGSLVTPPDTDTSTPSNSLQSNNSIQNHPDVFEERDEEYSYLLTDVSRNIVEQFLLLFKGHALTRMNFKVTPTEHEQVQVYLHYCRYLCDFVDVNVRYDYNPRDGRLSIMPLPGPMHEIVEAFLVDEVEDYLKKARASSSPLINKCARRIKWQRGRSLRNVSEIDLDPTYKPPQEPPTPELQRKSRRLSRTTRRADTADVFEATTSFESRLSGDSDRAEKKTAKVTTSQYYPDSSWAWQDLRSGLYYERPVVLEIAASETFQKLEKKCLDKLARFPISSILGINIESRGLKFHGLDDLEEFATYALLWYVETIATKAAGNDCKRFLNTEMIQRVLDPSFELCGLKGLPIMDLADFIPDDQMDRLEEMYPEASQIYNYQPFVLDLAKLRTAVMNGWRAEQEDRATATRGLIRPIVTRSHARKRRIRKNRFRTEWRQAASRLGELNDGEEDQNRVLLD